MKVTGRCLATSCSSRIGRLGIATGPGKCPESARLKGPVGFAGAALELAKVTCLTLAVAAFLEVRAVRRFASWLYSSLALYLPLPSSGVAAGYGPQIDRWECRASDCKGAELF